MIDSSLKTSRIATRSKIELLEMMQKFVRCERENLPDPSARFETILNAPLLSCYLIEMLNLVLR